MAAHGHPHAAAHQGHGGDDHLDWRTRGAELERQEDVNAPWVEAALGWLAELIAADSVRTVIDLGSGPGGDAGRLAARFGQAQVVAVDRAPALLERARMRFERLGLQGRSDTRVVDLAGDLHELPAADLIWASHVLHHVPDRGHTLARLSETLRPGGLLAVVEGGLSARFLPEECGVGEPGLLSRLDAAPLEVISHLHGHGYAERTAWDWPVLLREAGLGPVGSRSFLLDLPAPVDPQVRAHVVGRLEMLRTVMSDHLSASDRAALGRLLDPDEPLGVHRRADLFYLRAVTVHAARRR
jgi:SAM-dependent methyltransferase